MADKLPKEYASLLDQYSDDEVAKLAGVPVELVTAAREAAAAKAARGAKPADEAPVLQAPDEKPALARITIEVPEGVDPDKLMAKLAPIVQRAAEDARGAPKVVKYVGDERRVRLADREVVVSYGDIVRGEVAEALWNSVRHLVQAR